MSSFDQSDFIHYLRSKVSLDNRSLNKNVWDAMVDCVEGNFAAKGEIRILELGGGIGTMITRLMTAVQIPLCKYWLLDQSDENILYARQYIGEWAVKNNYRFDIQENNVLKLQSENSKMEIKLIPSSFDEIVDETKNRFDLVIAHAFLDLVDINKTVPKIFSLISNSGGYYFSINYDGITHFEPIWDPEFEDILLKTYNQTMDKRIINGQLSGDSKTGSHLFKVITDNEGEIQSVGASDWVVFPQSDGYIEDEEFFLHFIIDTIHNALKNHESIDQDKLINWVETRHVQIDKHKLFYLSHQLDYFGVYSN